MAKTMIQTQQILAHMLEGKSITFLEAVRMGIGSLSRRICDIKEMGIPVRSEFIKVQKANGETAVVKEYWLAPETIAAMKEAKR